MDGSLGASVVEVRWIANPFRGDRFEELWAPVAEAALDYGATAFGFLRSKEDQAVFTQLAFGFESKLDWERYWLSEEVSDARARAAGLFQVPVYPEWQTLVGFGSRALSPIAE
jgi:hypothetical protein